MTTVPPLIEVEDLVVKDLSSSGGRFVELQLEFVPPWGGSPDDPPLIANAVLDPREVRLLIEALAGWVATSGFVT